MLSFPCTAGRSDACPSKLPGRKTGWFLRMGWELWRQRVLASHGRQQSRSWVHPAVQLDQVQAGWARWCHSRHSRSCSQQAVWQAADMHEGQATFVVVTACILPVAS